MKKALGLQQYETATTGGQLQGLKPSAGFYTKIGNLVTLTFDVNQCK